MDAQVIHVDFEPLFSCHIGEDVVHKCLKSQWDITETKEYDSGLEAAEGSDECGLPLIFLLNVDVIVSPLDIELGEKGGIFHVID